MFEVAEAAAGAFRSSHAREVSPQRNGSNAREGELRQLDIEPRVHEERHAEYMFITASLAISGFQDFAGRVSVEPFVEPGFLEFIVAHQAIPKLVSELMDGDALRAKGMLARPEVSAARNERGILHAAGVGAARGDRPPSRCRKDTGRTTSRNI